MKRQLITSITVSLLVAASAATVQAAQVVPVIEVNTANGQQSSHAPSQSSELILIIQQLQDEMRQLRGQVESQQYQLRKMESDQKERYRDLDRRLSVLMQSGMGSVETDLATTLPNIDTRVVSDDQRVETSQPTPSKPVGDSLPAPATSSEPASVNDQQDYQSAFALVRQRDFNGASESFKRFLDAYPDSPRIPNAHYWLGEIYLAQGLHRPSEQAFVKVITDYPSSRKASDAMYKLGILYKQQGNMEKSLSFMRRVVKEYPDSSAARLAESALN